MSIVLGMLDSVLLGWNVPVELAIIVVVLVVRFFWACRRHLLEGRVDILGRDCAPLTFYD
jgi:hypothetical protein